MGKTLYNKGSRKILCMQTGKEVAFMPGTSRTFTEEEFKKLHRLYPGDLVDTADVQKPLENPQPAATPQAEPEKKGEPEPPPVEAPPANEPPPPPSEPAPPASNEPPLPGPGEAPAAGEAEKKGGGFFGLGRSDK